VIVGELSLNGSVRPVVGVLSIALAARQQELRGLVVPAANAEEAAIVEGLAVYPVVSLGSVGPALAGGRPFISGEKTACPHPSLAQDAIDFAEVKGQAYARRALEIAAAGAHNVLMIGPPGSGKTMLARRLPGILPPLELHEALELAQVRSLLGELPRGRPLDWTRPFRAPHHSVSTAGLIGGGSGLALPGEVSRAHHGVLFLDEMAEFQTPVLQALRQPLEGGRVTITRSGGSVSYPARFTLIAATNPCPCGWATDSVRACRCSPGAIDTYQRRLSGPLLDRIDLQVGVRRVPLETLASQPAGESSEEVRRRVVAARRKQLERQSCLNAQLKPARLRQVAVMPPQSRRTLERWAAQRGMTARGFHRAWRVARTAADLDLSEEIEERHVLEALGFRLQDVAA
jgi:magnesium chelatase family protein